MFGISGTELMIILFFGFLILGPEKLPQVGRTVGRAIRQFKDASEAANKKFKEEVADPFQDAIAPYKDQMDESARPIQEDIAAINQTLNETKSIFTDPFKDIFSPSSNQQANAERAGAVIATGVAIDEEGAKVSSNDQIEAKDSDAPSEESSTSNNAVDQNGEATSRSEAPSAQEEAGTDPFSGVIADSATKEQADAGVPTEAKPASEAKPIPQSGGAVKKSLAASLYNLDEEDGE